MSWADSFTFKVDPEPNKEIFAPAGGWNDAVSPWTAGSVANKQEVPEYQNDEKLKKQYGINLAKLNNSIEAACKTIGDNDKAIWISLNWLSDPIVIASKDAYLKTLEESKPPLDREQLAAKVLALAEGEKVEINGMLRSTIDAKDRVSAFKLYSEILGYTGKVEIDNSTINNSITNNELKILLVRPEQAKPTAINAPNVKSEILNENAHSPISLKLVKAG